MSIAWTLVYGGVEKTFVEWGLEGLQRTLVSQGVDEVTFDQPIKLSTDTALFTKGQTVIIKRNGVRWYYGLCMSPKNASSRAYQYRIVGPWWFLERREFQQPWRAVNPTTQVEETVYSTHLMLGKKLVETNGVFTAEIQLTDELLSSVIAWAIGKGAPITNGSGYPSIQMIIHEERDMTCAQVIQRVLQYMPDTVTWFDYTTEPYPTFHCARAASLAPISLPYRKPIISAPLEPRDDLQFDAVVLKYERYDDINGQRVFVQGKDIAPTGATGNEANALVATIDLAGFSVAQAVGFTKAEDILAFSTIMADRVNFWKYHEPWLKDERIKTIEPELATSPLGVDGPPRELLDGQVADWMGLVVQEDTITARVKITYDSQFGVGDVEERIMSTSIRRTDALSGFKSYSTTTSYVEGETSPPGLAQHIYDAVKDVKYSGPITVQEQEPGTVCTNFMGHCMNLTGRDPAWETMKTPVQTVSEDIDRGTTVITVGPPEQLAPADMVQLLSATRNRLVFTSSGAMGSSQRASSSVGLGKHVPQNIANSGGSAWQKSTMAASATAYFKTDVTGIESTKPVLVQNAVNENVQRTVAVRSGSHSTDTVAKDHILYARALTPTEAQGGASESTEMVFLSEKPIFSYSVSRGKAVDEGIPANSFSMFMDDIQTRVQTSGIGAEWMLYASPNTILMEPSCGVKFTTTEVKTEATFDLLTGTSSTRGFYLKSISGETLSSTYFLNNFCDTLIGENSTTNTLSFTTSDAKQITIVSSTTADGAGVALTDARDTNKSISISTSDTDKPIKIREMPICIDGVQKYIKVLCSEPYTK